MAKCLVLFIGLCALVALASAEETYSSKYDFINVDSVLSNERTRAQYYNCFADKGPCLTPDSKFFKEIIAEAIVTKCRKCTDRQKIMLEKIITYYTEKEPEKWGEIVLIAIEKSKKRSKQ